MALDTDIAQAAYFIRLFERALHDDAAWQARLGVDVVLCSREVKEHGVELLASFPHPQVEGDTSVEILVEGEVIASVPVTIVVAGSLDVRWTLSLDYSLVR
jgi:hypothetical protein